MKTLLLFIGIFLTSCSLQQKDQETSSSIQLIPEKYTMEIYSNEIVENKMLLVLSAPSIHNKYYKDAFTYIVDFQINYINKVIGNDNIVLLVDSDTKKHYKGRVPEDILLEEEMYDIWMRDFTTVHPENPTQFTYTWSSMSKKQSREVQKQFSTFADTYNISRKSSNLLLDGGNIVDNYNGKIITTQRFLEDNNVTYLDGKKALIKNLSATKVAILEPDEEVLAHSDGMVSWIDDNVLAVNKYDDREFMEAVMEELKTSFPNTKIIKVPVGYRENKPGEWEGFSSACGVNINAVTTYNNLYVPTFGMKHEIEALEIIKKNTTKKVIPIEASKVCPMGGSVRCLTWQLTGENAARLILAARKQ